MPKTDYGIDVHVESGGLEEDYTCTCMYDAYHMWKTAYCILAEDLQ